MNENELSGISVKKRTKWTDAVKDLRHSGLISKVNIPNLSQLGKIEVVKLKDLVDKLFHEGYQPRKVIFLNKDRFLLRKIFLQGKIFILYLKGRKCRMHTVCSILMGGHIPFLMWDTNMRFCFFTKIILMEKLAQTHWE
ncbi:hypothetical protein EXT73_22570 [Pectobacterium atrosepticum]|nr:hypothetical protein [Pectobacterium atrosepticum]